MAKKYGIYSATAAKQVGTVIWRHVDGQEVRITNVSDSPDAPEIDFKDKVCLGEVTEHVRGSLKLPKKGSRLVRV